MSEIRNNRLEELLIDRATDVLSEVENDELQSLLEQEQLQDDFSYEELVVGMQDSYFNADVTPLPDRIRTSVINQVESLMHSEDAPPLAPKVSTKELSSEDGTRVRSRREIWAWCATAASLAVAAFLWMQPDKAQPLIAASTPAALNRFMASGNSTDKFTVNLSAGNHASGKNGQATVHWDRKLKRGFLSLNNVSVNDPTAEQYQLWIIDETRGKEDRPSAGVFNIEKDGVSIFEFRSDLKIDAAQGFAITVEKPGGVAKSDLSKISMLNLGP